jgi:hypothetical protein
LAVERWIGPKLPGEIAGARRLDLYDIRAKLSEVIAGERACQNIGQIENADAVQEAGQFPCVLKCSQ